jgi:peptidyl-tRNA hydrolase
LSAFSGAERKVLDNVLVNAAMAVEAVLEKGATWAMNEFNNRNATI